MVEWGIWVFAPAGEGAIGGNAHAEDAHGGGSGDSMVQKGDGGGARYVYRWGRGHQTLSSVDTSSLSILGPGAWLQQLETPGTVFTTMAAFLQHA